MATHTDDHGLSIESAWRDIKQRNPTIHIEYNEAYRQQMFDKLCDDKYLSNYEDGWYKITFKGIIFNANDGYSGEFKRTNESETKAILLEKNQRELQYNQNEMMRAQTRIQKSVRLWTIVLGLAAIAAAVLAIANLWWDIWKFNHSCNQ